MTRYLDDLLLFFFPFVLFAIFLILRKKHVFDRSHWKGVTGWLAIAGAIMVIVAILFQALTVERSTGVYAPARIENGRIVPGRIE
jgi:asparagine N-glycosylation enzyme membrane subunit Stt3